ncbi:MAG: FAD-binding and (Fe-S)-binding domain-containing protein [Planctomycetota bacterium]
MTSDDRRRALARELETRLEGEVRFGAHDRLLYATDASIYQVTPIGVVVPRHRADLEAAVRFCGEHGVPVLPRGGGTSLAGQTVNEAVVIDCSVHCRRLLAVDAGRSEARVEPGLVLDDLNEALRPRGLMFGPDVATSTHANLGGMIGNNSAGARSVRYGRTVEHLRGLEVMLADGRVLRLDEGAAGRDAAVRDLTRRVAAVVEPIAGEIDRRYPRTRRRVDGYNLDGLLAQLRVSTPGTFDRVNLAHLLCGSEGTLAVTLAATLGLVPRPAATGLAIAAFASLDAALEAVTPILATDPSAVEVVDDVIIELAEANLECREHVGLLPRPGGGRPRAVLYVEYFADDAAGLAARFDVLAGVCPGGDLVTYTEADDQQRAWAIRKAGEPLLCGRPGRRKPLTFIEDTAVDPARLPEFVRRFRDLLERHGTTASFYAHASVGCLHIRPLIDLHEADDRARMEAIARDATDLVLEFEGALSGEHGDGRLRSHLLDRFYGRTICDAFAAVKAIFDPRNLMNPGNITTPVPMALHLRARPGDRSLAPPAVETWFRFEAEGGLGAAAELCNGAGVCRRTRGGTMCPSYRATRDERHATRGRGNALRLAVTGQLGAGAGEPVFDDPETLATLDLCLSCKACKRECPSNVDVARLKAEYLAQSHRARGGPPWSARLLGRVDRLARIGALAPRLATALATRGPGRRLAARLLGIDRRRSLPAFGPALDRWHARRAAPADSAAPTVVLLADCFAGFGESHVGRAAVAVLERLGYRVVVPPAACCGRAAISLGLLDTACALAATAARRLADVVAAERAVGVVGCEPSCVSAIVDDWPELRLDVDRDRVAALAARTSMLEDFLARRWDEHPRPPAPTPAPGAGGPVLLHGHCHQKALWGMEGTAGLLRRCAGPRLEVLDSGCCGLAGAFGYDAARHDLSMRVGELALFPAVRAAPGATVAAPGTSCRHQLRDALGVEAVHPVEIVRRALGA